MAESINITDLAIKPAAALTTADSIVTFTADGDTNQTPMFEAVAKANEENGCLCVQTAKLFIPTAEVLTLNNVPKAFGLTVPAGYAVQPLSAFGSVVFNSAAYATNTTLGIRYVGADAAISNGTANSRLISATASRTVNFPITTAIGPTTTDTQILAASDVEVLVESGDPTAGDSDITIYLTYVLIEL